jgi:hypothetical protein
MNDKGIKFDDGKPRWGLLPWDQLEEVVKVLTHGTNKYDDENWKHVDGARERYFDAIGRHLTAYRLAKEKNDPSLKNDHDKNGSGLSHLAHVICNALFLMWFDDQDKYNNTIDLINTPKTSNSDKIDDSIPLGGTVTLTTEEYNPFLALFKVMREHDKKIVSNNNIAYNDDWIHNPYGTE